jgi:hypothetical protein
MNVQKTGSEDARQMKLKHNYVQQLAVVLVMLNSEFYYYSVNISAPVSD